MACKNSVCSLPVVKASPGRTTKKTRSYKKPNRVHSPKHHNCSECHDHSHTKLPSLTKKIHENNGHQCTKTDCTTEAPHAHLVDPKPEAKSIQGFRPLELVINESKLPKWLKQLSLNASFLSPALAINGLLEGSEVPRLLKTLLSIFGMHFTNRGTSKLGRLGLTSLVATGAQAGSKSQLGRSIVRFIATSLVAIIEKFSVADKSKSEMTALVQNLKSPKQWKQLLPGLLNVEAKVQLIVPLLNKLISSLTEGMNPGLKKLSRASLQIILTSLSFVGFDQALKSFAGIWGKDSFVAAMVSATCGCCGSPVCAAAATDSALQNTL